MKNISLIVRALIKYSLFNLIGLCLSYRVQSGPFKGMRYSTRHFYGSFIQYMMDTVKRSESSAMQNYFGSYVSKLIGTYEVEIQSAITGVLWQGIRNWVNIGSGDGYYCAGISYFNRSSSIHAFDTSMTARVMLRRIFAECEVVGWFPFVHGECNSSDALFSVLLFDQKPSAMIVDVEGYETTILQQHDISPYAYSNTHIIVEIHEKDDPECADKIIDRFKNTHDVIQYRFHDRTIADIPTKTRSKLWWIPDSILVRLIDEHRTDGKRWLSMLPTKFNDMHLT